MSKARFIRAYADSLTIRELAEQMDCAPAYVRAVLSMPRKKVRAGYATQEAAVFKQREKARARSRRRVEAH